MSGGKLIGIISRIALDSSVDAPAALQELRNTMSCGQYHIAVYTKVSHYIRWIEKAKGTLSRGEGLSLPQMD